MSTDARDKDLKLTRRGKKAFDELVAILAEEGFGPDGPPLETAFAEIEQFGHQAGRMVARAVDARLAEQHTKHFAQEQPCPTCDKKSPPKNKPHRLRLRTPDGEVTLHEPACHCSSCRRDFFPSADPVSD